MIYTIGHTESYEKGFEKFKDSPEDFKKKGRTTDYIGGSVWKTRKDAFQYLLNNNIHDFWVYGVEAEWDEDTEENDHGEFRNLLKDAVLRKIELYKGELSMNNQRLAEEVTEFMFHPKKENSPAHAVQILIENLVLPKHAEDYTRDYLKDRILIFLESISSIRRDDAD